MTMNRFEVETVSCHNNLVRLTTETGSTLYVDPREVCGVTLNGVLPTTTIVHTRQGQMFMVNGSTEQIMESLFPSKSYYEQYHEEKKVSDDLRKQLDAEKAKTTGSGWVKYRELSYQFNELHRQHEGLKDHLLELQNKLKEANEKNTVVLIMN